MITGQEKPGRLHHIGHAVPSLEEACVLWRDFFGAREITQPRILPEHGVRVAFVSLPNAEIELLEPYGSQSPLIRFLERNPRGGQHHVCFEVEDLEAVRDDLLARGGQLAGAPEPRPGAHGKPVLFFHPKTCGGILVELMQA